MTVEDPNPPTAPSAAVAAAGVDHVRLSYHYLDSGDLDGYASLLHEDMRLCRPGLPESRGRMASLTTLGALHHTGKHELTRILADGDSVAVFGHMTGTDHVDFADFFTLSAEGLLLSCHRYYAVAPR